MSSALTVCAFSACLRQKVILVLFQSCPVYLQVRLEVVVFHMHALYVLACVWWYVIQVVTALYHHGIRLARYCLVGVGKSLAYCSYRQVSV